MNQDQTGPRPSGRRCALPPPAPAAPPVIAIVQNAGESDHFAGVPEALARLELGGLELAGLELGKAQSADIECHRFTERTVGELSRLLAEAARGERRVVVAVKDTESPLARYALRRAERARQEAAKAGTAKQQSTKAANEDGHEGTEARPPSHEGSGGVQTVLLMDGIVEYRNTFRNPWVEPGFLRPAPVDVVCACGEDDAARLRGWGNAAVATGLPRVEMAKWQMAKLPNEEEARILVATAKRPAFTDAEWERVRAGLEGLRDALAAAGMSERVLWRLTDGLDSVLGVRNAEGSLADCLAQSRWVITGVSTLMVEAMLAGRFVGLLHPHAGDAGAELWQRAVWVSRSVEPAVIARELVTPMLGGGAGEAELRAQGAVLRGMWGGREEAAEGQSGKAVEWGTAKQQSSKAASEDGHGGTAAENVARVLMKLAVGSEGLASGRAATVRTIAPVARVAEVVAKPKGVRRVVNVVNAEGTPVGGVTSWAVRMAREFAGKPELGYDVRTLLVLGSPEVLATKGFEIDPTTTSVSVLDPLDDAHQRVEVVRRSMENLDPDIVLPNYNDACFMAAVQVRSASRGRVRMIDIAHTDVGYYRDLASAYDVWDGGVGVSSACMGWMSGLGARGNRPVRQIVYGVPVAERAREVAMDGPLKLCYVGRMVEEQKRIGLLWKVIDGLEARGVGFEFHMIGDGLELSPWVAELGKRTLKHGRVLVHGRRSMEWVERKLAEMDVSVLVSSYEGTSISMLEAMGAGVVPCVTRVSSGVDDWVRDGESGIVVELDDVEAMAPRLAELARDRAKLAHVSRAAWRTAHRERSLSIAGMCEAYGELFDAVMAEGAKCGGAWDGAAPTDAGLRAIDTWRWTKGWQDDPQGADAWAERVLREAGYRTLIEPADVDAWRETTPTDRRGATAVLVRGTAAGPIDPEDVARWRALGLGVGVSPAAVLDVGAARVWGLVRELQRQGFKRFAVYGTGKHTQRMRALFSAERGFFDRWPWVGFIDDGACDDGSVQRYCGMPVVRPAQAEGVLKADCVILSSDVFEKQMWERTAGLRQRGVRVVGLYGADEGCGSAEVVTPAQRSGKTDRHAVA